MRCRQSFCKGLKSISKNVVNKFKDDLLVGIDHSIRVEPVVNNILEFNLEENSNSSQSSRSNLSTRSSLSEDFGFQETNQTSVSTATVVTDENKTEIVLDDPKFGMISLFKYHLRRGHLNIEENTTEKVYCVHFCSLYCFLPLLIFVAQWIIYFAFIFHENDDFDGDICPNQARWYEKLMMSGISILYFIRSIFLWDNLTKNDDLRKSNPGVSIASIIDTFQEYVFNVLVYGANIWMIFTEDDLTDMILNSVAMEFLMNLDNEFEYYYFKIIPSAAIDIYDNVFVTKKQNRDLVNEKMNENMFYYLRVISFIPFKIVLLTTFLFPFICFFMIFYGALCK